MDVIQCDVEETKGKVKDVVTHVTAGPGGCISIITHEQYRLVERSMLSGIVTPGVTSGYRRMRHHRAERADDSHENSNSAFKRKLSAMNRELKTKSVCTSTGDLALKTFKSLVLRNRGRALKTQATQTENSSASDQKDTSSSLKKKKGKKKSGVCKGAKRKKRTKLEGDVHTSVKLRNGSRQDHSMAESSLVDRFSDDFQNECQSDSTNEPPCASKSTCDLRQVQENPDRNL